MVTINKEGLVDYKFRRITLPVAKGRLEDAARLLREVFGCTPIQLVFNGHAKSREGRVGFQGFGGMIVVLVESDHIAELPDSWETAGLEIVVEGQHGVQALRAILASWYATNKKAGDEFYAGHGLNLGTSFSIRGMLGFFIEVHSSTEVGGYF